MVWAKSEFRLSRNYENLRPLESARDDSRKIGSVGHKWMCKNVCHCESAMSKCMNCVLVGTKQFDVHVLFEPEMHLACRILEQIKKRKKKKFLRKWNLRRMIYFRMEIEGNVLVIFDAYEKFKIELVAIFWLTYW